MAILSCSGPFPFTENLRVPRSGAWVTDDLPVTMIVRGAMVVEDFGNILGIFCSQCYIYKRVEPLRGDSLEGSNLKVSDHHVAQVPNAKPPWGCSSIPLPDDLHLSMIIDISTYMLYISWFIYINCHSENMYLGRACWIPFVFSKHIISDTS